MSDQSSAPALSIGDFAQITHLSRKTLRHYHQAGLLEPAQVDATTGYRYYSSAQIPTAQVIRRFRELGMPVAEVRSVLGADLAERNELIAAYLTRLEQQLAETQTAVASLRRLLSPAPPTVEVRLRSVASQTVAAISAVVDHSEVLAFYAGAMAELAALGLAELGPCGGLYDSGLFAQEQGSALVYLTVADPPSTGRVRPSQLPAAELATTVHPGPHDDIDVTYGPAGSVGHRPGPGPGGADPRALPGRAARHRGGIGLAHRDRLAGVPHRPVNIPACQ